MSVQIGPGGAADSAAVLGDGAGALSADEMLAAHQPPPFCRPLSQMVCLGTSETFLETAGAPVITLRGHLDSLA